MKDIIKKMGEYYNYLPLPHSWNAIFAAMAANYVTTNYVAQFLPCFKHFNIYSKIPFFNTTLSYVNHAGQYLNFIPAPEYISSFATQLVTTAILIASAYTLYNSCQIPTIDIEKARQIFGNFQDKWKNAEWPKLEDHKTLIACAISAVLGYCAYGIVSNFVISSTATSLIAGIVASVGAAHYLSNNNMQGYNVLKGNALTTRAIANTAANLLDHFVESFTGSLGYTIKPDCSAKFTKFLENLSKSAQERGSEISG